MQILKIKFLLLLVTQVVLSQDTHLKPSILDILNDNETYKIYDLNHIKKMANGTNKIIKE